VRKENVWLIVHPDEERIFVQPRPITATRGRLLRSQGYMIYKAEVVLPAVTDQAPVITAEVPRVPVEQWPRDDDPDMPDSAG